MIDSLKEAGLNKKQTAVYMAVLELGETTITNIAKRAGIKRPTTYLIIEELELLGLISQTKQGKKKLYSAIHPRRLLDIAKRQERKIEELLPELVAIHNTAKHKPKIQVFEGMEGVKQIYKDLFQSLNNKKEALWFVNIDALYTIPEVIQEYKQTLLRLQDPHIRELIYQKKDSGVDWEAELKHIKGKNYFIRSVQTEFPFGFSDNLIFDNKLVIFSLEKDIFVIVIESMEITKTYTALFELLWQQSKK